MIGSSGEWLAPGAMPAVPSWEIKFARAVVHLHNLELDANWFMKGGPYAFATQFDPETGDNVVHLTRIDRIPLEWNAVIGDCLQNFRAALDHMVHAIAFASGGTPTSRTEFPIFCEARWYTSKARREKIGCLPVAAQQVIDSLQPYHRGDAAGRHPLWVLHELSNIDKHRALLVTMITVDPVLRVRQREKLLTGAINHGPLIPGAEIARLNAVDVAAVSDLLDAEPKMDMHVRLNPQIAFEQPASVARTPALLVLEQIMGAVQVVATALAPFLGENRAMVNVRANAGQDAGGHGASPSHGTVPQDTRDAGP